MAWMVVVAPRGYVVKLDEGWDCVPRGDALFGLALSGTLEDGKQVAVNGRYISLAWREEGPA